ncbi:MAG: DUF748 domain-containing protein, partial [Pseudomonadales bacterium]|nr:DUF748 domain-containing protein [Pseudomonadales bacterium]
SAWWLSGILLLYTLCGFFLVPWLAVSQLQKILEQRLALTTQVESVYFNPFTFHAEVAGLEIDEQDGSPLLHTQLLQANFHPTRLLLLRLQFEHLAIQDLDLFLHRDRQGLDTLTRLAQVWNASAEPATVESEPVPDDEEAGPFPVLVESIRLANLNLHLRDEVPATPFETTLTLAQVEVANLSTLPDREGNSSLALVFEDQARLDWQGEMQLNPPRFNGQVSLENFALGIVTRYLQDRLPLTLSSGRLNASLGYRLDLSQEQLVLALEQINLAVTDLAGVQDGQTQPFLTATSLQLENGSLTLPGNRVRVDALQFQDIEIAVTRETDGVTNLQNLVTALVENGTTDPQPAAAPTAEPVEPWDIGLQRLVLADNRVSFSDRSLEQPAQLGVVLDLELTDLSNQPAAQFPFTGSLRFDSGGLLQTEGQLGALPSLNVDAMLNLDSLDLTVLQPYVNEVALVRLDSAWLDSQSQLRISDEESLRVQGAVKLRDLAVADQTLQERLLSLTSLDVSGIDYSRGGNSLDISELSFDSLFARVLINEDGSTNVGQLVRPGEPVAESAAAGTGSEPQPQPGQEAATVAPITMTIGRIQVNDAASDFTDLSLPLPFNANIHALTGTAEGFSAPSSQPMEFILEGDVDEYGLVQLNSSFNPFAVTDQSRIDLQFRNLALPPLTPYVIKFAGREIDAGNMDVDLSYNLEAGQLMANNQVVLRDLQLGDRVDYPDAMDLPLDLAMALLKDSRGVIDLEVPVSGDVNSPEFDMGPAIRRAITNILTNIVAAPFRLLGSLLGGGQDDDIGTIRFQAGRANLAPPERQVLDRLREALVQRPELVLEIPLLTAEADRVALQTALVSERVNARIEALPEGLASLTEQRLTVLETLYGEAGLTPDLATLQAQDTIETSVTNPLTGEPLTSQQLDVQAYVTDIRTRLSAAEPVSDSRLDALALERANSIRNYLTAEQAMPAEQVVIAAAQTAEPDDDGWLELEFGLQAGR